MIDRCYCVEIASELRWLARGFKNRGLKLGVVQYCPASGPLLPRSSVLTLMTLVQQIQITAESYIWIFFLTAVATQQSAAREEVWLFYISTPWVSNGTLALKKHRHSGYLQSFASARCILYSSHLLLEFLSVGSFLLIQRL